MTPLPQRMVEDALRFMRAPAGDEGLSAMARAAFETLEPFVRPRAVWGRFALERPALRLGGVAFHSRDLAQLLEGAEEGVLMAVTLGPEVDRQILRAQKRSMAEGLALDACASVRADAYADQVQAAIAAEVGEGNRLTRRFSPGYGDVPLEASGDIILALDATRRIGLSLTRSLMMTPVKSITAVAGIVREVPDVPPHGCAACAQRETCAYRRAS